MAVSAEFYSRLGDFKELLVDDIVPPGTYKEYPLNPGVQVFVRIDDSKSSYLLKSTESVYGIKYFGEEDEEGEIADLSRGKFELYAGEKFMLIQNGDDKTPPKEIWFCHTPGGPFDPSGLDPLEIPVIGG